MGARAAQAPTSANSSRSRQECRQPFPLDPLTAPTRLRNPDKQDFLWRCSSADLPFFAQKRRAKKGYTLPRMLSVSESVRICKILHMLSFVCGCKLRISFGFARYLYSSDDYYLRDFRLVVHSIIAIFWRENNNDLAFLKKIKKISKNTCKKEKSVVYYPK